jgi:hypothetical protein
MRPEGLGKWVGRGISETRDLPAFRHTTSTNNAITCPGLCSKVSNYGEFMSGGLHEKHLGTYKPRKPLLVWLFVGLPNLSSV